MFATFLLQNSDMVVQPFIYFQWMPFEEYTAQPFVQEHEFQRYIADVCLAKKDEGYSGFSPVPMESDFSLPKSYLYLNQQDLDF